MKIRGLKVKTTDIVGVYRDKVKGLIDELDADKISPDDELIERALGWPIGRDLRALLEAARYRSYVRIKTIQGGILSPVELKATVSVEKVEVPFYRKAEFMENNPNFYLNQIPPGYHCDVCRETEVHAVGCTYKHPNGKELLDMSHANTISNVKGYVNGHEVDLETGKVTLSSPVKKLHPKRRKMDIPDE